MESLCSLSVLPNEQREWKTNFQFCIICQQKTNDILYVGKSLSKLINCLKDLVVFGDEESKCIVKRIGNLDEDTLILKQSVYHKKCYAKFTHSKKINVMKSKFLDANDTSYEDVSYDGNDLIEEEPSICLERVTRGKKRKLDNDEELCIFCQLSSNTSTILHKLQSDSAANQLLEAMKCGYEGFKVKLSAHFQPFEVESQNIMYHKHCWATNVTNILRLKYSNQNSKLQNQALATDIEFIKMLESYLLEGKVTNMAYLEDKYKEIGLANNVDECYLKSRKQLRVLIEYELQHLGVEFTAPSRKNESFIISLKAIKDAALRKVINDMQNFENDMKILYEASLILRKSIYEAKEWNFDGSLKDIDLKSIVPKELFFFFKWFITGTKSMGNYETPNVFEDDNKDKDVEIRTLNLAQTLMYQSLSKRQSRNETSSALRHSKEFPLQVANGLMVHNLTRSQMLVDLFHKNGCSINYLSVMKIETQIANAVIRKMDENDGVFLPENINNNERIWFAADNIDFQEKTPDGKGTLHGTMITAYQELKISSAETQRANLLGTKRSGLKLIGFNNNRNPEIGKKSSKIKPTNPILETNSMRQSQIELVNSAKPDDFAWMFLQASRDHHCNDNTLLIPNWSSYNSLISTSMPRARVFVLPLLSTSSTDLSTQLKVFEIVEKLNFKVCPNTKAVLTLDMGLYQPMQQLLMSRPELKPNFVLRPGELHIIMAMLRSIGSFIVGSGIPETWCECNLYDSSVIKQILDGSVRRGIAAHLSTLCSLYICYFEEFYKHHTKIRLDGVKLKLEQFQEIFDDKKFEKTMELHGELLREIETSQLLSTMKQFDEMMEVQRPTFKFIRQYMEMVECMLLFIKSVRSSNWELHLATLEDFNKYFFAMNRINYLRMIPWYLHEMYELKHSDPSLWNELKRGLWVVNKSTIPFCSLGADEALEQENRKMKVTGGIIGITQNANALSRFFLTAPHLSQICSDGNKMLSISKNEKKKHHGLTDSSSLRHLQSVKLLCETFKQCGNPFSFDEEVLINITTRVVFDEKVSTDVCNMTSIGSNAYQTFVKERICTSAISLWGPVKKINLKLCSSTQRKLKIKSEEKVVELKDDRSILTKLLLCERSRPGFDLKPIIMNFELSAVPKSLFSSDGEIFPCNNKSQLFHQLENLIIDYDKIETDDTLYSVAIIDGMAEMNAFLKSDDVCTCRDLLIHFYSKIVKKFENYGEMHLIFDSYWENSLKLSTRLRRQGSTTSVHYKIAASLQIQNLTMKKLLAHHRTKDELTHYLAENMVEIAKVEKRKLVVSWRENVAASFDINNLRDLRTNHEEADTKIILHTIFVSNLYPSCHIDIHATDTDILVLAIGYSLQLSENTFFNTGYGPNRRKIHIKSIQSALGDCKSKALIGFHAMSGSDVTGAFHKKGKITHFKNFQSSSNDVLEAFSDLGKSGSISDKNFSLIEKFVCNLYIPGTRLTRVADARWDLYTKKQAPLESLPPTKGALTPAIQRAYYQAAIWNNSHVANYNMPAPTEFGWRLEDGRFRPVENISSSMPEGIMDFVKCGCTKGKCTKGKCKCAINKINCSELCKCGGDEDTCDNHFNFDSDNE